jgi:hypothetical protein
MEPLDEMNAGFMVMVNRIDRITWLFGVLMSLSSLMLAVDKTAG